MNNILHVTAKTISDAWFQLIYNIFDNSYKQDIQSGSFEKEQYRLQYSGIAVQIEHPEQDMVPIIPQGLGIPSPTTIEYIQDYFANYLMNPELGENETYKYASRINELMPMDYMHSSMDKYMGKTQLEVIIDTLKNTPLTNQACIEIAKPSDIITCVGNDGKLDPPCLRLIDFKVIPIRCATFEHCPDCRYSKGCDAENETYYSLTVSVYFRSWDLWAGFPTNLGGIELLKQYVAQECGLINGPMYAYSAGAHIYGYSEEIARIRTNKF